DGDPTIDGFVDVNNDGRCSPLDALIVINYLNAHVRSPGSGEGETAAAPPAAADSASAELIAPLGDSPGGEGESTPGQSSALLQRPSQNTPQNAAEYYATRPLHFLHIAGADKPCNCPLCVAARSDTNDDSSGLEQALSAIASDVASNRK